MRLVKQSILYFKEGNSDKVYEIDLCDVGNDKYVVNFRYGRRYSKLKEGSKTPVPVTLADAEKLFNEVEAEKISKGYSADGNVTAAPQASTFTLTTETTIGASFMSMPAGRTKGILQRVTSWINACRGWPTKTNAALPAMPMILLSLLITPKPMRSNWFGVSKRC